MEADKGGGDRRLVPAQYSGKKPELPVVAGDKGSG